MRKQIWGLAFAAVMAPLSANAYLVSDTYVGSGKNTGGAAGDVIGDTAKFDVLGLDASISGSVLTVDIFTKFVDHVGVYPTSSSAAYSGKGIGFGDLFLATSWNPYGTAPSHIGDNATNGTLWQYGVSLDNRWSSTGGNAALYQLNGATNSSNALLSNDFMKASGWEWRNKQEVAVKTGSTSVTKISDASWAVNKALDKISFTFDLSGTSLLGADNIAFHWAMSCGNDTIEGQFDNPYEVPAPAAFGLALLAGLGLLRRRRR